MANMSFAEAKRIRGESLSNRIASRLVGGESFGSSISKSLSEGTKAKITGLKEKINPMNIAKFMTGGSNLAAAITGRITGASKENMKYFTGKQSKIDTATKIKPIAQDEGILELLNEIYLLLEDSRRARLRDMPTEEDIMERDRKAEARHKALIDALNGKMATKKEATATKEDKEDEDSIFDSVLTAFGLKGIAQTAISSLGTLAKWAVGPIGGPLLGAATLAAFAYVMYKMFTDESGFDKDPNSELNKGLRQAKEVGGLAGVLDEMEKRKKLPEYERTMAELKDAEKIYWKDEQGNPQKGTDKQLEGYARRGPESAKAVEDYKKERDAVLRPMGERPAAVPASPEKVAEGVAIPAGIAPTPVATTSSTATPVASPIAIGPSSIQASTVSTAPMATPVSTVPSSAAVSSAIAENLEMNIPTNDIVDTADTINNTFVNTQNQTYQPVIDIPSVRNSEETFRQMILYSTRVV